MILGVMVWDSDDGFGEVAVGDFVPGSALAGTVEVPARRGWDGPRARGDRAARVV
ncbi:hypothetical protein DVS28_a0793 [Euzebya pacifica]|uniref:Uncharacterized protein n=1 Tax=Euzebya pacifica TaxID=1608957 RepID=A0A346XTE7_9ACTN|nr:hypothetical protein DVS28_a0793 [Euzebya pacifica]